MKKTVNFLLFLLFAFNTIACNNTQSNNKLTSDDNTTKIEKIEVYYFHYTRRCATCIAVENETKKILKELYPEKIKNEQIIFQSINLDQGKSEELAEKYKVAGQTLLFVSGTKTVNLTNKAFMYARTPDKLKKEIKATIEQLTN
jgi:hypothetical protein